MFEVPYYNSSLRKLVIAFGTLFSNIKIARENNAGVVTQTINVPIAYGQKEKQIVRTDSDPELSNHTYITVPRLSFEILGYGYDSAKKVNKMSRITCQKSDGTRTSMFSPAPYNINMNLYLLTKTIEDAYQVLEQVLPLFTPEYTVSINAIPSFNYIDNVPIILNSVDVDDGYQGSFEERRFVLHTFNFTAKMNFFLNTTTQGVIKQVNVNITEDPTANYQAVGTLPGDPIVETWTEP